jgi:hypothetical protein
VRLPLSGLPLYRIGLFGADSQGPSGDLDLATEERWSKSVPPALR